MSDAQQRQALVQSALFGSPVLEQIEWAGAAWPFTVQLLARLQRFGEIAPGQPALAALLAGWRPHIGVNRQAELDALLPKLNAQLSKADDAFVAQWEQGWEPANQAHVQPPDWRRFRLGRIAEWSQPRYDLEKRFVNDLPLFQVNQNRAVNCAAPQRELIYAEYFDGVGRAVIESG